MDLKISTHNFLVGGASSGFGLAISKALIAEGANVIAIARGMENLQKLKAISPANVQILQADITLPETMDKIDQIQEKYPLQGAVINAGGPPAMTFLESNLDDWDEAYRILLRWKLDLSTRLVHRMKAVKYGRILYIESSAVKQPLENLVLSTSMRLAVVGFVKTLSREVAADGVNLNILAPGYHETEAVKRVFDKRSQLTGMPVDEVKNSIVKNIPVGFMGKPEELGSLASWLLSPVSEYITGQTISVDGGNIAGIFG